MDHIDTHLASCAADTQYSPSLRAAFALGKNLLNKYYSLSDFSDVYRIAIILDPRRKLSYARKAGWPDDWIETAKEIVTEEFRREYVGYAWEDNDEPGVEESDHGSSRMSCSSSVCPFPLCL